MNTRADISRTESPGMNCACHKRPWRLLTVFWILALFQTGLSGAPGLTRTGLDEEASPGPGEAGPSPLRRIQAVDMPGREGGAWPEASQTSPGTEIRWQRLSLPASQSPLLLAFMTVDQFVEVYSEGEDRPFYSHGKPDDGESKLTSGNSLHMMEIPAAGTDHSLWLRIYAQTGDARLRQPAILGHPTDVFSALLRQDLPRALLACLLFLGGLVSLGVSFFDRSLLYWGGFLVSFALWLIAQTLIKQWIIPDLGFWRLVDIFALFQAPIWIFLFTDALFGPGPFRLLRRCWQYHAGFALSGWVLIPLHLLKYGQILLAFQISSALVLILFSGVLALHSWRGDREARSFLGCALVMILATGHDYLAASGILSWSMPISLWGILPLIVWTTLVPLRRHLARRNFAEDTSTPENGVPELAVILQTKFGLTLTEVRLCLAIDGGLHRDEILRSFKLRPATLKTHLSTIFRKTIDRGLDDPSPGRDKVYRLASFLKKLR